MMKDRSGSRAKTGRTLSCEPSPPGIPLIFGLEGLPGSPRFKLAECPADVWIAAQQIPIDRWIFGQFNKLLPAKANARALARFVVDDNGSPDLKTVAAKLSDEAERLGDYLSYLDSKQGRTRDDSLATAFPTSNSSSEKSRDRYSNQFVANFNGKGEISGLLVDLKLINLERKKDFIHLRLTEPGWTFAVMRNPILDDDNADPHERFSEEEVAFLLNHIAQDVPVEAFAFHAVLAGIEKGHTTPNSLDSYLARYRAKSPKREITDAYLTTQRSGVVARLSDLMLIRRVRDGIRVSYQITDRGKDYLPRLSERRN